MAKGQRTKAGHILQMIWHGPNPNLFNPNGKRVVAHNAEDYDYIEGIEFDKLTRKGAKALVANVPLEEMWTGKISGPLHYNLMDDQIFPFWIAKGVETPVVVDGVNCIDTEYVRPQLDRADRAFFAIEEGKAGGGADLGCYGMFTSFKWNSKRGNKGTSRFEVGFTTQAAVPRPSLTGGTKQNHKTRVAAANVTGPVGLSIGVPGATAKNVSLAIGDDENEIEAAFAAEGVTVNATGGIVTGAGQVDSVSGSGPSVSINGVPVDFAAPDPRAKLQTDYRASDLKRKDAVVSGTFTKASGGFPISGAFPESVGQGEQIWTGPTGSYRLSVAYNVDGVRKISNEIVLNLTNGQITTVYVTAFPLDNAPNIQWYLSDAPNGVARAVAGETSNSFSASSPPANTQPAIATTPNSITNATIAYPDSAGDVDAVNVVGAGYTGATTAPGAAGGILDLEFTDPDNTVVTVTKTSGDAGYVISTPQYGSDGGILTAMKPDDPIMPGHLFLYSSDTPAGLDDEANLVGQIGEWDIDDPKICMPVSHHVRVNDPERPNLPATYNAHAEEESQEDGIKLSVTMDADETGAIIDGMKALLRASGKRLVSVPRYWRIAAIHPRLAATRVPRLLRQRWRQRAGEVGRFGRAIHLRV